MYDTQILYSIVSQLVYMIDIVWLFILKSRLVEMAHLLPDYEGVDDIS